MTLQDFYYPPNGPAWNEGVYTVDRDGVKTPMPVTGEWVIKAMLFTDVKGRDAWSIEKGLIQSGEFFGGAGSAMMGGPTGVKIGEHIYPLDRFELVSTYGFTGGYHITFNNTSVSGIPL
jgi:hypothetical protein